MEIKVDAEVVEQEPARKACSLLGECRIEPGRNADYKLLAAYHYRDHRVPPAIHQVYRALHEPSGRVVGAIVYAAPALNLGVRNKIFGDRYKIGGGKGTNDVRAARLNAEVELIIRVVVHPTFRGVGLGRRLIAETLELRPYRYIEMSAAMGEFNPFAERAGMTRVHVPRPENTERVIAALRSTGMPESDMGDYRLILAHLEKLPVPVRSRISAELIRYATRWIKSRTNRVVDIQVEEAARRLSSNCLLAVNYFLWENPKLAS